MSGLFGVSSTKDCINDLFYGADYHSHLGTQFGGIAVLGKDFVRSIHNIGQTQFKSKFYDELQTIKGGKGIAAVSGIDEQPVYLNSKFGPFCIVTEGLIENASELAQGLMKKGISFVEVSHKGAVNNTELVAKMITQGKTLVDGIEKMFAQIEGSISLLLLNHEGVYAARDRYGYTPLVVGKNKDGYAVAAETCAFTNLDYEVVKYLDPGEITLVTEKGMTPQKQVKVGEQQICSFLWIYTGFPASSYEGINVEEVREKCGQALARQDRDIEVDQAAGVPDSGTGHAIGYSMESGKPYRRPFVKYTPGYGRSYTPPSQDTRDFVAKMKLISIREIIKDQRIALCEDSIVRGTQLKNFTIHKLWNDGAKEIHVRPACPPLMYPCKFCLSTRSIHELAARKAIRDLEGEDIEDVSEYIDHTSEKYQKMVDWIAKDLDVTTLRFLNVNDMVEAIGVPKEKLCLYCWTGECPSSRKEEKKDAVFQEADVS